MDAYNHTVNIVGTDREIADDDDYSNDNNMDR